MLGLMQTEGPSTNSIGPSEYKGPKSTVKVLWSGYDTLYLSYRLDLEMFAARHDDLAAWKQEAQGSREGTFLVDGPDVYMSAKGRPNYQYVLIRPNMGEVAVTLNPLFPPVRVRVYSEYIAACGGKLDVACDAAHTLVEDIFGWASVASEQISEVHVAADFMGWTPRISEWQGRRFLSNSVPKIEEYDLETDQLHSMRWAGSGRPISAALYNKCKEIREQSPEKVYMHDIYKVGGWDQEQHGDVYRVEFRLNRDGLRSLGIEKRDDVDVAAIFRFMMGTGHETSGAWLSFRGAPVGTDTNNRRWPVAAAWLAIRDGAIAVWGENGVLYKRVLRGMAVVDRLVDMAGGCVASVAALVGEEAAGKAFSYVWKKYIGRLERKRLDFQDVLSVRHDRFRLLSERAQAERDAETQLRLALRGVS